MPVVLGSSATATSKVTVVAELLKSTHSRSCLSFLKSCSVSDRVSSKITHGKVHFPLTLGRICDCVDFFPLRLMEDLSRREYSETTGRYIRGLPLSVDLLALVFP